MTEPQNQHLNGLLDDFERKFSKKYEDGQKEHGGDLFDHGALWFQKHLEDEILDAWAYCRSMRPAVETLLNFIESKGFSMDDVREYALQRSVSTPDKSLAAGL